MTTPFLKNSTVKQRLKRIQKSKQDLQIVYDREMRRLNAEVSDIQARCCHPHVIWSDNSYDCKVCGYSSHFKIEANVKRAKEVQQKQSCPRAQ